MLDQMTVRFWGVRGSYPVPGTHTTRFGGNTACVEVRAGDHVIILDAGTGIVPLGRDLLRRARESGVSVHTLLLFSHMHPDHFQGFPFFAPAYVPTSRLDLYGPNLLGKGIDEILNQVMCPPAFPVTLNELAAWIAMRGLSDREVLLLGPDGEPSVQLAGQYRPQPDEVAIRCMRSYAHPGGVSIYRIEWRNRVVVYATDTEGYANLDRRLVNFGRDAGLLIHDAQYTEDHYLGLRPGSCSTQGFGHSTPGMACSIAAAAGVRKLALFHYDPSYTDQDLEQIEEAARQEFSGAFAPYEGLEIQVEPTLVPAELRPPVRRATGQLLPIAV